MSAHLLTLADLHAAAPGVLDVVFGPDGDFEGAPRWAGPMTSNADLSRYGWLVWGGFFHVSIATHDGHWQYNVIDWRAKWALDLRIPSVAARLAGLCARALVRDEVARCAGREIPASTSTQESVALLQYVLNVPWVQLTPDQLRRLASLTLALAPRIAALGGTR